MKSAIKKVFWFYTILFLILIGYLVKLCLFDSNGFVANSFNPRLTQGLPDVKRGAILERLLLKMRLIQTVHTLENMTKQVIMPTL